MSQTSAGTVPAVVTGPLMDGEPRSPRAPGVPGLRLVIGVDGDPREWVQVANALLDCIASGAVRAGSRVPPVRLALGLLGPRVLQV